MTTTTHHEPEDYRRWKPFPLDPNLYLQGYQEARAAEKTGAKCDLLMGRSYIAGWIARKETVAQRSPALISRESH